MIYGYVCIDPLGLFSNMVAFLNGPHMRTIVKTANEISLDCFVDGIVPRFQCGRKSL